MHLKIIEPAEIELHDAFEYYEIQNPGLGKKFIEEFNKGISRIPKAGLLSKAMFGNAFLTSFQ